MGLLKSQLNGLKSTVGNNLAITDKVKKSASLFTTMVLSLFVGIVISIINTRHQFAKRTERSKSKLLKYFFR